MVSSAPPAAKKVLAPSGEVFCGWRAAHEKCGVGRVVDRDAVSDLPFHGLPGLIVEKRNMLKLTRFLHYLMFSQVAMIRCQIGPQALAKWPFETATAWVSGITGDDIGRYIGHEKVPIAALNRDLMHQIVKQCA